ncbi:hypothetical protein BDF19DRAFT_447055 [Syncephalis fuscata]|nr:hypothetical protein BDF19DRAFT_447055 [Syncephalis fuscata]
MSLLFSRISYSTVFTVGLALSLVSHSLIATANSVKVTSLNTNTNQHHHHQHSNHHVQKTNLLVTPRALSSSIALDRRQVAPGQRCGGDNHNQSCPFGQCCSQYGWCGVTTKHCSTGCQNEFGKCNDGGPREPRKTTNPRNGDTDNRANTADEEGNDNPGLILYTCKVPRSFAMTFDDGPGMLFDKVLETLARLNVKATFFINGNNVANLNEPTDAQKVLRAFRAGHQIASHTYSHADLDQLNDAGIRDEMGRLDRILVRIIGRRPVYMRPPFGNANTNTQRTLNTLGYRIINWNIDTLDWQHPNDAQASLKAYREALDRVPTASQRVSFISLQHDIQPSTATNLIEDAVRLVRQRGFRLMRVDECMGDAGGAYRD